MIKKIITGNFGVNLYIVYDDKNKVCSIIDPGTFDLNAIKFIESKNLKVEYIILTHGHGDHLLGVLKFKEKYKAKVIASKAERELLSNANLNFSNRMIGEEIIINPDIYVKENDIIFFGDIKLRVIETPGHTKGGICLLYDDILFSGDTLFFESVGRCDLFGGNFKQIVKSINDKLMVLSDDVIVYPGHGTETTIGYERDNNKLIRE